VDALEPRLRIKSPSGIVDGELTREAPGVCAAPLLLERGVYYFRVSSSGMCATATAAAAAAAARLQVQGSEVRDG
jgi:hypothetical protein